MSRKRLLRQLLDKRSPVSSSGGDVVAAGRGEQATPVTDDPPVAGSHPSATTPPRPRRSTRASDGAPDGEEGERRTFRMPIGQPRHQYDKAHRQQAERLGYTNSELEEVFQINSQTCSACGEPTTYWRAAYVGNLTVYQCRNEVACVMRQMRKERVQ